MPHVTGAAVRDPELARLTGLPFHDSDDVYPRRDRRGERARPADVDGAHDRRLGLLDELPGPFMLIAMDLQGAMSEPDKQSVRERAFDVVRDYRDAVVRRRSSRTAEQMRVMLDVMSAGQVTEEFVDYIAADLRLTDVDQNGPVLAVDRQSSVPASRSSSSAAARPGCWPGIKLKAGRHPVHDHREAVRGGRHLAGQPLSGLPRRHRQPVLRLLVRADRSLGRTTTPTQPEILQYLNDVMAATTSPSRPVRHRGDSRDVGRGESATWQVTIRAPTAGRDADVARADLRGRPVQQLR